MDSSRAPYLTGTNTYSGGTYVTSGYLNCASFGALGTVALNISTGAKINLNYTGNRNIASLTLGGTAMAAGTYGSTASPATNKDDTYFSGTGTVTIGQVNRAPVAAPQSVSTAEDTQKPITLSATDADGNPLSYSIVVQPAHGVLIGTAPNVTYAPFLHYNGPDNFIFKANDGTIDSAPVIVSITVTSVNDAPFATPQSVAALANTAKAITLQGTDPDGSALTYTIVTPPASGTLSGTPPNVTYTPAPGDNGPASFTFKVNDGTIDSAPATVSITVNYAPVATAQSVTTAKNTAKAIALSGTDAENSTLTYTIVSQPAYGTLSGSAPNVTYTPATNFNGSDSFTFKVNDGTTDSAPATVSITVNAGPVIAGGDFQLYKPSSTTVTAELVGGGAYVPWSGVIPPANLTVLGGSAAYSDSTTGSTVDLLGWAKIQGNLDIANNGPGGSMALNCYAAWGGDTRVETTGSLHTITAGETITISVDVSGGPGGPMAGPLAFHLYANGSLVTPSSSVNVSGEASKTISRTYDPAALAGHIGATTKIVLGVEDANDEGNRVIFDNVTLVASGGSPWTYSAWTGDADSGISSASPYTAAVNFAGAAATVNGVAFQASALTGTNFSIGGAANEYTAGTPNITGNSLALASSFIYNANPRTVTLTNLTPGATYETSLFAFGWEASGRIQTFASGSDSIVLDQDLYGNQNGIRIAYTFVADSSGSKVLTITPGSGNTFHLSALANRLVSSPTVLTVTPVAVTAQSYYAGDDRAPIHAIDGTGMSPNSPVTASSTCGNGAGGNMWLSDAALQTWITFDLGSVKTISGFHLWNYNEQTGGCNQRSIKDCGIYAGTSMPANGSSYASQGSNWGTLVQNMTLTMAPGTSTYTGEDYTFTTPVTTRYLQIQVINNYGGYQGTENSYTGISEIRFYGPTTPQADMVSFGPGATIGPVTDNAAAISWTVPFGSNVTTLSPTITLSSGATCVPANGTTQDFTNPVNYVVKSADNLITNTYTVTVTVAPDESTLIWNVAGGPWDLSAINWKGQSSNVSMPFYNGKNVIFESTAGGTVTIASGMEPLTTTVSATAGTYAFSGGPLAGTGTLTKSGNGNLSINANNTYSGGTIINAGQVTMEDQKSGALGTGPVTLNGGTLYAVRINTANPLIVTGGRLIADGGWGGTWSGPVTLNGDLTVYVRYYDRVFLTGNISGAGGLTVGGDYSSYRAGEGVFLTGTNTYTGTTQLTSGAMLHCSSSAALGTGPLNISSGALLDLNFGGTRNIAALTLGGVAQTAPGTYGSTASGALFQNDTYFAGTGTVTVVSSSPYDTWANGTFANPFTAKLPTEDPDGDGQSNQQEFTFGLDPTTGSSANPITQPLVGGVFKYTRTKDSGLIYKVYYSTNLSGWTWDEFAEQTPAAAVLGVETVTVTLAAAAPLDGKLFVRVEASPAP